MDFIQGLRMTVIPSFSDSRTRIRIVSPSGVIDPVWIDGAKAVLESWGLEAVEGRFAREEYGRFAGTTDHRVADLQEALDDPDCAAILCSRGGYGLVQIIDKIDFSAFIQYPKWVIGFSDITVLHNKLTALGFSSLHAAMAKHITLFPADEISISNLKKIIFGNFPVYHIPHNCFNRAGSVNAKLVGGNLSVLYGLRATPFDIKHQGAILFIEDIGEKPYHIDRMLQNLRLSGVLSEISGLIVGQFTDCPEDPLMMKDVQQIIADAVTDFNYPVCFGFPAGHDEVNYPLILGKEVLMQVGVEGVFLDFR